MHNAGLSTNAAGNPSNSYEVSKMLRASSTTGVAVYVNAKFTLIMKSLKRIGESSLAHVDAEFNRAKVSEDLVCKRVPLLR